MGLTCLDLVYYVDHIPNENKKVKTNSYYRFIGGPAANAAITYSMLGGKATLITQIGNSELGKTIINELCQDYNVQVIDCADGVDVLPSIASIAINVNNASRTIWSGQQIQQVNYYGHIEAQVKNGDFFLSDCNLPELSYNILKEARKNAKTIVLDAGSWKSHLNQFLSISDEVIASADCKPQTHNQDFILAACDHAVKYIAVTNGEELIKWKSPHSEGTVMPPRVEPVDTLAAGDIFHGAYCFFRFEKNLAFEEALCRASEVAALSVEYVGPRAGVKKFSRRENID